MLDQALRDRPDHLGQAAFSRFVVRRRVHQRTSPGGGATISTDLGNGWTVETSVAVRGGGVLSDRSAFLVLIAGVTTSLLFALLVLVLGTGAGAGVATGR